MEDAMAITIDLILWKIVKDAVKADEAHKN
jgi:hypothetical protein